MPNTFKRKFSRSIGTANTQIGSYSVPGSTQTTVIGLTVANIIGNPINVSVRHNDGSANTHLVKNAPVPVGGSLVVVGGDQKLVLEAGDSVYVSSNTATSVDAVMSILEIT